MIITAVQRNLMSIVFKCLFIVFFLQDMEEFVQSSEEDGIVVFSLGSMINNITREKADMMASALAQIPQKVSIRKRQFAYCSLI